MDNVHFHFNGDVTINISLPDNAGKTGDAASYRRLVDSLGEYLHDAAAEVTPEAKVDFILNLPHVIIGLFCSNIGEAWQIHSFSKN